MKSLERTRKRHVLNSTFRVRRHPIPLSPRPRPPTSQHSRSTSFERERSFGSLGFPPLLPARFHGCFRGSARGPPPGAAAGAGGRVAPAPRRAQGAAVPVPRERVGRLRGRGRRDCRAPGLGRRLPGDLRVPQGLDRSPRLPRAARPRRHPAAPARHVRGGVRAVAPHRRQGGSDPFQEDVWSINLEGAAGPCCACVARVFPFLPAARSRCSGAWGAVTSAGISEGKDWFCTL